MGNKQFSSPILKERVVEALKDRGKTQKEMAAELGISPEHLSRCLKKGQINISWLIALSKYLDVSPEWLSDEEAVALNNFGYERKQAINNQDQILIDLFLLLGWSEEQYDLLSAKDRAAMKNEFDATIAYFVNKEQSRKDDEG